MTLPQISSLVIVPPSAVPLTLLASPLIPFPYSFSNSLGTTWSDTYPTSIGASTGKSCFDSNAGGPALASDDTGTFNPNYNGGWGKTTTQSGSPYYWHEGLWDVDSKNNGGLGTVWLR